ncbi:nucleoside triphosphate pyrophosphatase [Sphingomonas sp. BIUV-7]|uniref:Nucleoside triphosphate pyrophosphatase n=1 Tax=Sphingomonas natans TaxID=3063330 RepID=A0ABT8YCD5_9SPHN|nr:nucleoside triphosphate pyrophosphatase [Sphingomonas sp. BIUV-7]MDO6415998.1 nucleoside triphosphate pyrophosphatase [Sphingomonas sp. BIUV-7]
MTDLILASQSASRKAMLAAAGVPFRAEAAGVDEESVKAALIADGLDGRGLADALAELKAIKVSRRHPEAFVLGCDSTVQAADGALLDKAEDRAESRAQLAALAGTTHRLASAAVVALGGQPIWRHVDVARLTMRPFSDAFLDSYIDAEWPAIGGCVGGYRIEGLGAQLFSRIEGSQFTIMGLPLLPLLDWLRVRGVIPA